MANFSSSAEMQSGPGARPFTDGCDDFINGWLIYGRQLICRGSGICLIQLCGRCCHWVVQSCLKLSALANVRGSHCQWCRVRAINLVNGARLFCVFPANSLMALKTDPILFFDRSLSTSSVILLRVHSLYPHVYIYWTKIKI